MVQEDNGYVMLQECAFDPSSQQRKKEERFIPRFLSPLQCLHLLQKRHHPCYGVKSASHLWVRAGGLSEELPARCRDEGGSGSLSPLLAHTALVPCSSGCHSSHGN